MTKAAVVLTTLNAKYIHASLGLRYLMANLAKYGSQELRDRSVLKEFTISRNRQEVVQELLALDPAIIGFGVYIWNVSQTLEVIRQIKTLRPTIKVILGGPEVSHETEVQEIVALADHVITGWGEVSFPKLCLQLLSSAGAPESVDKRLNPLGPAKIILGEQLPLDEIELPYGQFRDEDLDHRILYVEASRGCPFKCEFCLSSLDKTAWPFDLDRFLAEISRLFDRGARQFKFVDRTFNLKVENSLRILQFFLDRLSPDLTVHFEVIPDYLPERLKDLIVRFPPGVLQFEVGVQTFNVEVQSLISRKQNNDKTIANIGWLVENSSAHLHADLIFGLPGESASSFARGFDRLYALGPHEIQLGLLKRLRGTPIARHDRSHGMIYSEKPPYAVLQSAAVSAEEIRRFTRLARYWDLVANSGRFNQTLRLLTDGLSAYAAFSDFSDWLWKQVGETANLTPEQLVDAVYEYLTDVRSLDVENVRSSLLSDYLASGARASPKSLRQLLRNQPVKLEAQARKRSFRQSRNKLITQG